MSHPLPSLFDGLNGRQRDQALACFEQVTVLYGTPLMVEGDVDASLLCVLDGELEVRTGGLELHTAKAGEIIGEIGLFSGGMRTATVETNTEATLLILTREGYNELLMRDHPLAMTIEKTALSSLVRRLRSVDARISETAKGTAMANVTPSTSFFGRVRQMFGSGGARQAGDVHVATALAKSQLFKDTEPALLSAVASLFQAEAWGPGQFLCTEGEPGEAMYMLADGQVDVLIATEGDSVEPVATLAAGDSFGMAGLVDQRPRSASCVTRTDVTVLRLDRQGWTRAVGLDDAAGRVLRVAMIRSLSGQLAFANGQLALLELTKNAQDLTPLLLATAGVEAQGQAFGT
ncbi:MAG: cyclic nucleotide-binding domain-containing protein [Myxococcota bacterium]